LFVGWFVGLFVNIFGPNIMQTTGDTGSVPIDLQLYGQDYGESNDYVIDDVT